MIKKIKGLKYPEEFVVRFFFKEKLNKINGKVLELGCGNGNNLLLFTEYDWDVYGVDINNKLINNANFNFNLLKNKLKRKYHFKTKDMFDFVKGYKGSKFDCFLLPSSLYYMSEEKINGLLRMIKDKKILKTNSYVYFRIRLLNDYRSQKAKKIKNNTYKINFKETNEINLINTFFKQEEFINLLNKYFTFSHLRKMKVDFQNYNGNLVIDNKDLIVWGKLR